MPNWGIGLSRSDVTSMGTQTAYIVVLITASSQGEAYAIGKALVEGRLAACVNLVPGLQSLFWWQGRIDEQTEALLVVKTRSDLLPSLIEAVKRLHSYSVPEIIALPILGGAPDYLSWLDESVG